MESHLGYAQHALVMLDEPSVLKITLFGADEE